MPLYANSSAQAFGYLKRDDPYFDALIVGEPRGNQLHYKEKARFGFDDETPADFVLNGGSYFATLPSGSLDYRIKSSWSAYVQAARLRLQSGRNWVRLGALPKQQKNTTYQAEPSSSSATSPSTPTSIAFR